ncbi:acyl-CoA dehydrogenase family protein [Dermatobacter hominis]|uniref:acyl-CoA dehydrogenase family protein n=1 Tax=Dermatobacter hominis TaxID=2884263 RepID=UPI001D106CB7|nr:acyl-CoA dehydrogenase family protein [Dermatobacter hominis]UDY35041.1 acyl-CoA/acyl-ACP dehydrogenase [Dermatobacter hominis]
MDFELSEEQAGLRDAAHAVLADACPPSVVRRCFDGGPDVVEEVRRELWAVLVGLDWAALAIPVDHGGLGLGPIEVGIVAEELGRVVAPAPFLATCTQFVPALRAAGSSWRLDEVAAGAVTGALALAEHGRWTADAVTTIAARGPDGWVLSGTKSHVLDGASADEVVVVARAPEGLGLFVVPGDRCRRRAVRTMDPTLPLAHLELDRVDVGGERALVEPGDPRAAAVVDHALEHATAALAVSTVATCRSILDTTVQYALDRVQFGRPIGSFQAVKHRLADCLLAVERAGALAWFALLTLAEDDGRRSVAVSMAKVAAGDCQRLLVRDGLQLHGGVGFTWEHDLHLHLKRAAAGELLLGTAADHRARLASLLDLVDAGAVPADEDRGAA